MKLRVAIGAMSTKIKAKWWGQGGEENTRNNMSNYPIPDPDRVIQ